MFCAAKGRKNGESRKNTALPRVCWPLANVGTALWLNYIFNLSAGGALQAIKWQIKFSSGFYFICHSGACNFCIFCPAPSCHLPFSRWQMCFWYAFHCPTILAHYRGRFSALAEEICWIFHECHKFLLGKQVKSSAYAGFSFAGFLFLITFHCGCQRQPGWQAGPTHVLQLSPPCLLLSPLARTRDTSAARCCFCRSFKLLYNLWCLASKTPLSTHTRLPTHMSPTYV